MRRRFVVLGPVALAALAALVFGFLRLRSSREAGPALDVAAPAVGRQAVLHVRWHETSTARLPHGQLPEGHDGSISGELELEADLVLARERTTDGDDAILAELRDVRSSRVVVSGQDVLESDEAGAKELSKHPIHFVLENGKIVRVLVDKNASSVAVQLTENVARQVLLGRPQAGATFERDEQSHAGTLRVRYEKKSDVYRRLITDAIALDGLPDKCEGPCTIRARGEGEVTFEDDNAIQALNEKREIHAGVPGAAALYDAKASFEARRVREEDFEAAAVDPNALAGKLPGEVFESEAEHKAALGRLAAGVTVEDVVDGFATAAAPNGGMRGLPQGWLVRSAAYLELNPDKIAEVAIHFEDDDLGVGGRMAVLDLLAATGGEAAQTALLRTLDTATARMDDEGRLAFVQRLVLVETPSDATARAVRERFAQSQGSDDHAMAYAEAHVLGAMAYRLAERGSKTESKAAVDSLAGALDKATTTEAKAAYVSALGNAGDPSQVGRISSHAKDKDTNVRRSVASALRKTNDKSARGALVDLAKDADEDVQMAAIDSLGHHPLDGAEQRDLAHLLASQDLGGNAEQGLVTLLLRQGSPSPEVRGGLEALLGRTEDPRLAARIRFALESSAN